MKTTKINPPISRLSRFSFRPWRSGPGAKIASVILTATLACSAGAANINWQGGTADYTNAADWVGGVVPGSGDNAINDNGTNNVVQITANDPNWAVLDIRAGNSAGSGAFVQNAQTVTVNGWFRLGISAGDTGVYTLNGGTINYQGGDFNVGELGVGILYLNGGTITGSGNFADALGAASTSTDMVFQTAGVINSTGQLFVGNGNGPTGSGEGIYNMSGGTNTFNNYVAVGRSGGYGVMNMSGGLFQQGPNGNFLVGTGFGTTDNTGSQGTLNQSGGTISCQGQFLDPESSPSVGTYNMSGTAALVVNNWIAVGRDGGSGTLNMNGGSIIKTGNNSNHVTIGSGGTGVLNETNGTVTSQDSDTYLGETATGTWNVEAGSSNYMANIIMAVNGTASGTLNLDSGLFQAAEIVSSSAGFSQVNFNGGTLQASGNNANFMSGISFAQVESGGAVIDSQNYSIGIPVSLQDGGGGLTKNGTGTLTLTGANSYSGPTVVNAGTLVTGTSSSAGNGITVADNAGFGVMSQSANGQYTTASLSVGTSAGGTLDFNLGGFGNPTSAPLNVSGALTVNGAITVNISDSLPQLGVVPLVQFGSVAGSGGLVLGPLPVGVVANLTTNGSVIGLNITSVNQPYWDGLSGGTWDIDVTTNWYNLGTGLPTFYTDGSAVVFDDSASGTTTVNVTTGVSPKSVAVNNTNLTYTFAGSGSINGSASLTKNGTNVLTILNNNGYTGPTIINGGTLSVTNLANGGSPSPIGAASASPTNLIIGDGVLNYQGTPVAANRGFTIAGTNATINTVSNLVLSGAVTAVNSIADGGSAFTKTGPGQLDLNGSGDHEFSQNYTLGVNVVAGTLMLDGSAGNQTNHTQNQLYVGDTTNTGANLILSNATLGVDSWLALGRINGGINNTSTITMYNSSLSVGNLSLGWDGGLPGNLSSQFVTLYNSTLTNYGSVNLDEGANSSFVMALSSNSVFWVQNPLYECLANDTTGAVVVANSSQIIQTSGWIDIGQGSPCVASLVLMNNASLVNQNGDLNVTDTGNGAISTVTVQDNANLYANNLWVGKATGVVATMNINGNATVTSGNGLTMSTRYDGTPEVTTSTLNLNGGSLAVNLVQGNTVSGTNYGVFNFNGGKLIARNAFATDFMFNLAAINVQAGGGTIDSQTNVITIAQPLLAGGGSGGLTKVGSGTLLLNGANTYTGTTVVSAGTLGGTGSLAGPVNVAAGGTLMPGITNAVGILTINNMLSYASGSTALFKLTPASNDQIEGLTGVTYGGALVVTNISGSSLTAGTVYNLFHSSVPGTGNFSSVTILPAGTGTFNPANGELTIGSTGAPVMSAPLVSGGNLIMTGTGGSAGAGYTLLSTTNLVTGSWVTNTTGTFQTGGTFTNSIPLVPGVPAEFFQVRTP